MLHAAPRTSGSPPRHKRWLALMAADKLTSFRVFRLLPACDAMTCRGKASAVDCLQR
jgi:hypothetical protein